MADGFIMLARKFFKNMLWTEDRSYSRAEAWIDLLQMASFENAPRLIAGSAVEVPRGGIVASVRFLSDRWKWSNTKVCLFLDLLVSERMISKEKRQGITVISLCNFEKYNSEKRRESDEETTPGRRRNDEYNKDNKDKNISPSPVREEILEFASNQKGWDESVVLHWFSERSGQGWLKGNGLAITNWKADLESWVIREARGHAPHQQKGNPYGQNKRPAAGSGINAHNTNQSAASGY